MFSANLGDTLKPYLWLALAAFLTGFLSFFALGEPRAPDRSGATAAPLVSAPASGEWNLPKEI